MSLVEQVKQAGVVGAGGGGFPAHVKLEAKADTVIANGAECEPLLHKDAVVLEQCAAQVVEGLRLAMTAVGASQMTGARTFLSAAMSEPARALSLAFVRKELQI